MKRKIFRVFFALVLVLSFSLVTAVPVAATGGSVVWVNVSAATDGDGTEALPFDTIQEGINDAAYGDTVQVAAGTYNEDITLKNGVQVLGAGEASTTINGTGTGSVVTASGVGPATKLDGFTVTGGNTTTSHGGGGMYIYNSSLTVSNCTFSGNTAPVAGMPVGLGGGMFNANNSSPTITNCTFSGNSANQGGGGMCNSDSSPTVTDCTFFGNSTNFSGGGMANRDGSTPTVTDCTFYNNTGNYVGGMYNSGSPATVTNCTFSGNTGQDGGGMANSGCSPTVTNCIFYGNHASRGGGMYNNDSSPTVTNCTFSGNSTSAHGGAIYNIGDSTTTVTNCILWDDSSPDGPEVCDFFMSGHTVVTTVTYSDIEGGWPGTGNNNYNPWFSNPAAGDYHLKSGSPCIDAGNNTAATAVGLTTDFEGDDRIIGAAVDMGADEFLPHEVWVAITGSDTNPGTGALPFATIQMGIDTVAEGGTVNVVAGTYNENVLIDKSLTLQGADKETTIINGGGSGVVVIVATDYVTVSGFTITGSGSAPLTEGGVALFEVTGCTIEDNIISNNGGIGIGLQDADSNTIRNNILDANHITGIGLQTSSSNTIESNTATGAIEIGDLHAIVGSRMGYGIFLDYGSIENTINLNTFEDNEIDGVYFGENSDGNFLTNNTIHDNGRSAADEGAPSQKDSNGIYFWNCGGNIVTGNTITDNHQSGIELYQSPDNIITNNTITGNNWDNLNRPSNRTQTGSGGILFRCDVTNSLLYASNDGNIINGNSIHGNTDYDLYRQVDNPVFNPSPGIMDAQYNWWGDASGPGGVGAGIGGVISGNVDYSPWYVDDSYTEISHIQVDDDGGNVFTTIQAAINAANDGDTVIVAAGIYDESVTIGTNNLTITGDAADRPVVTGGLKLDTLTGLTLENFYVTGVVSDNSVVRMDGAITDLTIDKCVFDGENVAARHGFSGGQLEGDVSITSSEFKNILGWAVVESRSGTGGDGSAMDTVTFAHNNVHDCNGSVVFRGLSTDRTDLVNAYDNTWNNIGDNESEVGQQWAALEVNRAFVANVYDNTVNDVAMGIWDEGQAFQFWDIDTLNVYGNDITNNYQGIWIWGDGGTFAVPGGYISFNNIIGNNQYGISIDPTATGGILDATNNWWGDGTGPQHATTNPDGLGNAVSDNVEYDPWIGAGVEDSKSEKTDPDEDTVDATTEADTEVLKKGSGTPTITVTKYTGNPGGGTTGGFSSVGNKYIDVHIDDTTDVEEIEIRNYYTLDDIAGLVEATLKLSWWDGTAWIECSDSGATYPEGEPTELLSPPYRGYVWAIIPGAIFPPIPTLDDLAGTPFMSMAAPAPAAGGGGGGGGPLLPAGTTDVRGMISTAGVFYTSATPDSEDGLSTLTIPAGTVGLTEELEPLTIITMLIMDEPPSPPEHAHVIGLVYDFQPSGATFEPPVTLQYSYDPADIPEGIAEEDLVIAYYDQKAGEWVECECTCDPETDCVTGRVYHFTAFTILGYEVPEPAAFTPGSLVISPTEVDIDQAVNVSLSVANTGGMAGSYKVTLKIDGEVEATQQVTVGPGASEEVTFTTSRDVAGSYSVDVNGLSGSFTVKEKLVPAPPPPPPPAPPEVKAPMNWPVVGGIIAAAIVAGLAIFFLIRRRRAL